MCIYYLLNVTRCIGIQYFGLNIGGAITIRRKICHELHVNVRTFYVSLFYSHRYLGKLPNKASDDDILHLLDSTLHYGVPYKIPHLYKGMFWEFVIIQFFNELFTPTSSC